MTQPYYDADGITLYHGDARMITEWAAADVLVTDPPYGMAYTSGRTGRSIEGDLDTGVRDAILSQWGVRPALVFGRWNCPPPPGAHMMLTWDKEHWGMGDLSLPWGLSTEQVYVLGHGFVGRRAGSVLRVQRVVGETLHPNEKPRPLMSALLRACPRQWTIADPFAGSGTTLVAAHAAGRRAIGVELDEAHCATIVSRLAQTMLFQEPDPVPPAVQRLL